MRTSLQRIATPMMMNTISNDKMTIENNNSSSDSHVSDSSDTATNTNTAIIDRPTKTMAQQLNSSFMSDDDEVVTIRYMRDQLMQSTPESIKSIDAAAAARKRASDEPIGR